MTTMPMEPMTCDGFADALMGYLEHDAPHAVRVAVDAHAATCASCAELLADIRAIERNAASLPQLQPSRDLWAGIAARIEAPVVDIHKGHGTRDAGRDGKRFVRTWARRGLIAAGLVAVSAAGTWMLTRGTTAAPAPQLANVAKPAPATQQVAEPEVPQLAQAEPQPEVESVRPSPRLEPRPASRVPEKSVARLAANPSTEKFRDGAWRSVDSLYGAEIGRLRRLAAGKRSQLDPATLAVIEKNLKIIDQAIRESRAAIARDPNSALLNDQINRMLDQKVELLRALAASPVRS